MTIVKWTVETLGEIVDAEFDVIPQDIRARFLRVVDLIEEFGLPKIGMPHVRSLGDKLWEIRASGRDGIARGIFVIDNGKRAVILHVFIKKTEKTPPPTIRLAKRRAKGAGLL